MHFTAGNRSVRGLTAIEVLTVIFVLVLLVGLVSPAFGSRHRPKVRCVNNLKNVGLAMRIFAIDNDGRFPFELSIANGGTRELHAFGEPFHTFKSLSNEISTPKILICPQDKQRAEALDWANFCDANLSYFLNISVRSPDATNRDFVTMTRGVEQPTDWVAGDRNLIVNTARVLPGRRAIRNGDCVKFDKDIHKLSGNIARLDGSVAQLSNNQLLSETNHEPYVLLIP